MNYIDRVSISGRLVYINDHKFMKVIIDALTNSAIVIIFFGIFLTGVFSVEINIKKKNNIEIDPNIILTAVIPVRFVKWYKLSSPYLLRNTSRKAMYFSLLRPLVPSMIEIHR